MLIIVAAIIVALILIKLLRWIAGPVILVAAIIFAWSWVGENFHWGSYSTSDRIPAGVVTQDRPL